MPDIYFDSNYGKLYEKIEKGKSIVFEYEGEHGKVKHMFIKREIPNTGDETYYDIVTPYGYGGPIIIESHNKDLLVTDFQHAFDEYCTKNKIISEFVRFHPVLNNEESFMNMYDVQAIRRTAGTNLGDFEDPFMDEFSKSCRKNIRKALKSGVTYKVTEKPNDVKNFLEIYYSTMDRKSAQDYYYFDENYFNQCLEYFQDNILIVEAIYENQTIAMGFYFVYGDFIHTHLSGTLSEYLHLSPAYILRHVLAEWGKENDYKIIHHGGGTSNDSEDSLYKFKKQFGKNTDFQFSIGKKIWNQEIYEKLCSLRNVDVETDFFPAYRKGL